MTRATDDREPPSASSTAPRGRRPGVDPERVLDVAEELLAAGGFDALSVRRIADEVGVSRQVVYTHFGGMDGLLDALHQRLSARLARAVDHLDRDAVEVGSDDHVIAGVEAYRSIARRWPELYQLVFEHPVADHVVGERAAAYGRESFGGIIELAREWLVRHDLDAGTAESTRLARTLWSTTHGFVVLERVGFATPAETDDLSDTAILAILAGWAGRPA